MQSATLHPGLSVATMKHKPQALFPRPLAPAPVQPSMNQGPRPRKLRRITRACDYCHKRSIRCQPSDEEGQAACQNCVDFAVPCTYDRPAKKRGTKSGQEKLALQKDGEASNSYDEKRDAQMLLELTNGIQADGSLVMFDKAIPEKWRVMMEANEAKIRGLVDVYFEVIYPIYHTRDLAVSHPLCYGSGSASDLDRFPTFHMPTMLKRTTNREYLTNHAFFTDVMAVCALSSARVRDGALFPGRWDPEYFQNPPSEVFFAAAKESMPQDLSAMRGLDWLRACGLLALYGIQVGRIGVMHQYLALYRSLVDMDGLHDENNWPKGIGIVETELRRRQFWSMYSLEVFASVVWGHMVRCREAQCLVNYPSEIEDELFSDAGYHPSSPSTPSGDPQVASNPASWLHGWNFTVELYRILEHAVDEYHRYRPNTIRPVSAAILFTRQCPGQSVVMDKVMEMHDELPQRFKEIKPIPETGHDGMEDKFSFQAANITATLLLVRMMLFTAEDVTVDQKCAIARELLEGFGKVPVFFLRAISSPLLHQLAGIGSILSSAIEGPISESSYIQVRDVLLTMADLLSSLEIGMTRAVGAASHIRSQISAIENYMKTQRQLELATLTSNPAYSKQELAEEDENPNIDPVLQEPGDIPGQYQQPQNDFQFKGGFPAGLNPSEGDDQFQFQLPPELLEGWPWPFDN